MTEKFGKIISNLRKEQNLTQREMSIKLAVSVSTIAMWETGRREPDYDTILKLAGFFNVSVDYILGKTNNPHGIVDEEFKDASPEIRVMHRAARNMTPEERKKMLLMMKIAFDKAFEEDED